MDAIARAASEPRGAGHRPHRSDRMELRKIARSWHFAAASLIRTSSWVRERSMLRALSFALTLLQISALSLDAHAATKTIRFGRLWDGHRVIANATVIV